MSSRDKWISVGERLPDDREKVDVWMHVYASPRSFGMADDFRVPDAYRKEGKWFHLYKSAEAELQSDYITHWMPVPKPPRKEIRNREAARA